MMSTNAFAPKVESGAYSSGRMQGFGNTAYNAQSEKESKMGVMAGKMKAGFREGLEKLTDKRRGSKGGAGFAAPNVAAVEFPGGPGYCGESALPQPSAAKTAPALHLVGLPGAGLGAPTPSPNAHTSLAPAGMRHLAVS